jgi:hypothetical protein
VRAMTSALVWRIVWFSQLYPASRVGWRKGISGRDVGLYSLNKYYDESVAVNSHLPVVRIFTMVLSRFVLGYEPGRPGG